MNKSHSIANRIREVFLNGKWIANTNYQEILQDIHLEKATQKRGNLNTIAALCFHINYYLAGLLEVFRGGKLEIRDKFSFDLPPLTSEEDWRKMVRELLANAGAFALAVEGFSDEKLDQSFVEEKYGSYSRNIEAVIEHSYYHLGQIVLLVKLTP